MCTIELSPDLDKYSRFEALIPQLEALVSEESDLSANLSNLAAALKEA